MNVLSLFDGIGTGKFILDCLKIENKYYFSEIDKNCVELVSSKYHDAINVGDVTKIDYSKFPRIDLLLGGSPCQGFSFSGKHKGFVDDRSILFFEFLRAFIVLKPRYFMLENVNMKTDYVNKISDYIGLRPIVLCSSSISAIRRKRLYWTNIPFYGLRGTPKKIVEILNSSVFFKDITNKYIEIKEDTSYWKKTRANTISLEGQAFSLTTNCMSMGNNGFSIIKCKNKYYSLSIQALEILSGYPENYTFGYSDAIRANMIGNAWQVDVVKQILSGVCNTK
jgi:site-specific DNA-cytosine methylase